MWGIKPFGRTVKTVEGSWQTLFYTICPATSIPF